MPPPCRSAAAADAALDAADLLPGAVRGGGGELGRAPGRHQHPPPAPLPLHGGERRSQEVTTIHLNIYLHYTFTLLYIISLYLF